MNLPEPGYVTVLYKVTIECWSDGTMTVKGEPDQMPADVFFNAAATIIRLIADKSNEPISEVMEHVQRHVDAATRIRTN